MSGNVPRIDRQDDVSMFCIADRVMEENCYLLVHEPTGHVLVVDPGYQAGTVIDILFELHLEVTSICLTHCHPDHAFGAPSLLRAFDATLHLHSDDLPVLSFDWAAKGFLWNPAYPTGDFHDLKGARTVSFEGKEIGVKHTPGHTKGSVTFLYGDWAITGDTLFRRAIGNSIPPFGDATVLERSIRTILYKLPSATSVYPGHGASTTIGEERAENPFVSDAGGGAEEG